MVLGKPISLKSLDFAGFWQYSYFPKNTFSEKLHVPVQYSFQKYLHFSFQFFSIRQTVQNQPQQTYPPLKIPILSGSTDLINSLILWLFTPFSKNQKSPGKQVFSCLSRLDSTFFDYSFLKRCLLIILK